MKVRERNEEKEEGKVEPHERGIQPAREGGNIPQGPAAPSLSVAPAVSPAPPHTLLSATEE